MNARLLFLLIASYTAVSADDCIENGDFSAGLQHWRGDVRDSAETDGALDSAPTAGVLVPLRAHEWTMAQQEIRVNVGTYKLHVTISPSADLHFSDQYADYIDFPQKMGYTPHLPTDASTGEWAIVVADTDDSSLVTWTTFLTHPSGSQSYTFTIKGLDPSHGHILNIAFPPGSGSVTLQHVSMAPAQ
jgi:hypothetical protein